MGSHGGAPGAEDADDGVRGVGFEFYGECVRYGVVWCVEQDDKRGVGVGRIRRTDSAWSCTT